MVLFRLHPSRLRRAAAETGPIASSASRSPLWTAGQLNGLSRVCIQALPKHVSLETRCQGMGCPAWPNALPALVTHHLPPTQNGADVRGVLERIPVEENEVGCLPGR